MNDLKQSLLSSAGRASSSSHSQESNRNNVKLYNDNLASFFHKVDSIAFSTEALRQAFDALQEEQLKLPANDSAAFRSKMQTDMQKIISQSFAIKLSLDDLDQDNVKNRSIPGCHANSSVDRVRIFVTNGLRQRLSGFLSDFSAFQKKVRDDHRDDVRRRVFTVTGKLVSEESVNKMIESGEAETFLRKAIEGQGKSSEEKMKAMVRQIEDENASVRKLEESLLALQNIFLQMSVLVQMQGAELNDIERNMLEAMSYISAGMTDLESAADKKKSTNRCWVIAVVIVVLLLLAGVAVLLVYLFVL